MRQHHPRRARERLRDEAEWAIADAAEAQHLWFDAFVASLEPEVDPVAASVAPGMALIATAHNAVFAAACSAVLAAISGAPAAPTDRAVCIFELPRDTAVTLLRTHQFEAAAEVLAVTDDATFAHVAVVYGTHAATWAWPRDRAQ